MNSKKALGLITLAGACASFSAFANTTNEWFVADASANPALVNVTTNGTAVVENNRFVIDNEPTSPFTFTPPSSLAATNSTNIARIDVKALLTASRTNDFAVSVSGAKVGFAVGINENNATNYYGYLDNAWKNLGGVPNLEADTAFSIILNFRDGQASFIANGVALETQSFTPGGTLTRLDAYGEGSIASITSSYEVAVAAYGDGESEAKKYGSVAEAMVVAGSAEKYKDIETVGEDGAVVEGGGTDGKAANGLQMWECTALGIKQEEQIGLVKSEKQNAGKITLSVPSTMQIEPGVTAKFKLSKDGAAAAGDEFDPDNIQIPMNEAGSHVYTIVPVITVNN